MSLKKIIKENARLKRLVHWMIVIPHQSRPRFWVKFFRRVIHSIGKGAILRGRLDLFPFNGFQIGKNSIIESYSVVNNGVGDVLIGNGVTLGIGSVLIGPVSLGDDVIIAQHVVISGLNHTYEMIDIPISKQGVKTAEITVGAGSWIGANVTIAAGVRIGRNCVIGAGSVVTKDVPDYMVAVGNPARCIKGYSVETQTWQPFK